MCSHTRRPHKIATPITNINMDSIGGKFARKAGTPGNNVAGLLNEHTLQAGGIRKQISHRQRSAKTMLVIFEDFISFVR